MAYHGNKTLYRDTREGKLAGVCAGLSEYLTIDVTIIRIIALILLLGYGTGALIYIIMWVIVPQKEF